MAYLWTQTRDGDWAALWLVPGPYRLVDDGPQPVDPCARDGTEPQAMLLWDSRSGTGHERWVVLCRPRIGLRVNGEPVWLGLRVVQHRDELRLPTGTRFFLSTEHPVEVVPFPGGPRGVVCPRCRQPIELGDAAVRCPGCESWHHQRGDLACWSYDRRCSLCPHPTDLDAGLQWRPETD